MKSLHLIPVVFVILAIMVSPVVMSAYADPSEGKPKACYSDNPGKAVGNKHCQSQSMNSICDSDNTGFISYIELATILGIDKIEAVTIINAAELVANIDINGSITTNELSALNAELTSLGFALC